MVRETVGPTDWEALPWEKTPYPGVSLIKILEELNPENPNIPSFSMFLLRVNPGAQVPRHIHKREPEWREQVVFGNSGIFEILRENGSEIISNKSLIITIKPYEVFGLKNLGEEPLLFTSSMKPGFTGYQEIHEVQEAA